MQITCIKKSLIVVSPSENGRSFSLIGFCILTALITAVIPFLTYPLGLRSVEASKAGIIATLEQVVATIIGILCFSEMLTVLSALGIILVLSAVVVLNIKKKE